MAWPILPDSLEGWTAPLRRNVPAKLFAAAFAFSLWFFVNAGQRETQVFQFPIEFRNVPEGMVVANAKRVETVEVKLNGPGPLLASLDTRRLAIQFDLSSVAVGREARLKIRDPMIHVPRGVRILDVEPSRVPIRLEELRVRRLPVSLTRTGEPRKGYEIASIELMPNRVAVSGAASAVDGLKKVETEPVDVSDLSAPTERTVALARLGPLVTVDPQRLTVRVDVQPIVVVRELKDLSVTVRNVDQPFRLGPSRVNLTVRGPQVVVAGLALEPDDVFVDGAAYEIGEHRVEASAVLPAGVEIVRWEPATLTLSILASRTDGAHE